MADNYEVLDGTGTALMKASKDTGSAVQADKVYVLDTALAEPFGSKTDAAWTGSGALAGIYSLLKGLYVALTGATPAGTNNIGGVSIAAPLPSGGNIVGAVLGRMARSIVGLTTTAAAYTAGNVVGGVIAFTNCFDAALTGYLTDITVKTASVQTVGYKLYLFSDNPTASTFTDKTAPAIAAADKAKLLDVFTLGAYDNGLGTHTINQLNGIAARMYGVTSTLYGVLVTTGTPTYASTADVTVEVRIDKD